MDFTCFKCKRTYSASRTDSKFCSEECKAAYFRIHGATLAHITLEDLKSKMCDHCGGMFWYNAYADRSGARAPKFCSDRCRMGSWRDSQKAAKKAHENTQNDSRSWDAFREREQAQQTRQEPPRHQNTTDYRDRIAVPRRWNEQEARLWITNDRPLSRSEEDIRKAWRELNQKFHPDRNGGRIYKHLSTINAAYDFLKRVCWRKR